MRKVIIGALLFVPVAAIAAPVLKTVDVTAEKLAWIAVRDIANTRIAYLDSLATTPPPALPPPTVTPPPPTGSFLNNVSDWIVTSGVLKKVGDKLFTDSGYFRAITKQSYYNADVSVKANIDKFYDNKSGHGQSIFLRYQTEYNLYVASYGRADNKIVIKKKCLGGPNQANGGTYYELSPYKDLPFTLHRDTTIRARVFDEGQNVKIELYKDGVLVLTGLDTGQGCARIKAAGKVGLRSDDAIWTFWDFQVK